MQVIIRQAMQMNLYTAIFALLASSASLFPLAALAQVEPVAQSQFDGIWMVGIACPSNTEDSGAKGYRFDFPAKVEDGVFSGSHGEEGTAGSLKIEGQIPTDGNAEFRARGRTGNPDYAAKRPSAGTPYSYKIKAHFERTSGTGSRIGVRVCDFTFTKQ
ncbi:MAG: hypothetical protein ABI564_01805 [Ideonella sp.]